MDVSRNDLQKLLEVLQPIAIEENTSKFLREFALLTESYLVLKLLAELRTESPATLAQTIAEHQVVGAFKALSTLSNQMWALLKLLYKAAEAANAIPLTQQQPET